MKQIIAVVKPFVVQKVISALAGEPLSELVVREVKGFGRQKSYLQEYDETEYSLAFLPKVEILVWVESEHVDSVVDKIVLASRTGRIGDGKILVIPDIFSAAQTTESSEA